MTSINDKLYEKGMWQRLKFTLNIYWIKWYLFLKNWQYIDLGKNSEAVYFYRVEKKIRNYVNVTLFTFVFISLIDHVNVNCFEVD